MIENSTFNPEGEGQLFGDFIDSGQAHRPDPTQVTCVLRTAEAIPLSPAEERIAELYANGTLFFSDRNL